MVFLLEDVDDDGAASVDALFAMLDGYCCNSSLIQDPLSARRSGSTAAGSDEGDTVEQFLTLDELITDDFDVASECEAPAAIPAPNDETEQTVGTSEAPPTPVSHAQSSRRRSTKKRSWDPNKARKEKRAERQYLRQQVAELEAQLTGIRAEKLRDERMEIRARKRAEQENIRMKLVLENQIQVANSLQALISATVSAQEIRRTLEAGADSQRFTVGRLHCEMFLDLLADTDKSYDEVDSVLGASGLALDAENPHLSSRVHCNGADGLLLEVVASQPLPFDLRTASGAVWHYFTKSKHTVPDRVYNDGLPKILDSTADMSVEFYNWLPRLSGTQANFGVKQVLRRFEESERVVFVWRALIDLVEFASAPVSGVRFLEKGYIVVSRSTTSPPPPPLPSKCSGSESVLRSCYIITPLFSGGDWTDTSHPSVGTVTKFVLHATAAGVSRFHRMVESVLIHGSKQLD